jgi:hypothetical protein
VEPHTPLQQALIDARQIVIELALEEASRERAERLLAVLDVIEGWINEQQSGSSE